MVYLLEKHKLMNKHENCLYEIYLVIYTYKETVINSMPQLENATSNPLESPVGTIFLTVLGQSSRIRVFPVQHFQMLRHKAAAKNLVRR